MSKKKNHSIRKQINFTYFPLFLLLLAFFTYGILLPYLGFYWDDFPYTWFAHIGGANGVFRAVAEDRPLLGLLYAITLPLLQNNPLLWQIFAILTHWLCALLVFHLVKDIWPYHEAEAAWTAILFLVFPGFSQQWISVIYSQLFLLLAMYFYSLLLMVYSLKNQKFYWLFTLLSIFISLFSMVCSEYTVGLEFIRPLIIYFVLPSNHSRINKDKLFSIVSKWIPYLASLFIFGIYRVFIASSVLYSVRITSELLTNPLGLIMNFLRSSMNNLINAGIISWLKPFSILINLDFNHWIDRIYVVVIVMAVIGLYVLSKFIIKTNSVMKTESNKKQGLWLILLGLIAIIISGIPFFTVRYELNLSFPYDRIVLPMMLGSCLFLLGIIQFFFKNHIYQRIFLILLISFSIGSQFMKANEFREDWENMIEFFWQLRWRVPDMEKGTMLLTDKLPLSYYSDNSLTAPLNWIYKKPIENNQLPLILNYLSVRLGNRIPSLEPNTPIDQYYRIFSFLGNTSNSLVMQYLPPGCLHILDPELDRFNPNISSELTSAIGLTNFSQIITRPKSLANSTLFPLGKEPAHNWCFYYESAALAQQSRDWEKIVRLGEKAFNLNDYPNDPIERFPFIEAYAHLGRFEKALELSKITYQISPMYSRILCALWDRIEKTNDINPIPNEIRDFLSHQLSCK